MADDLSWFSKAKQSYPDTEQTEPNTKRYKGFGEQAGEVLGGVVGSIGGALGEVETFFEETPAAIGKLATEPVETFKDFARNVKQLQSGYKIPETAKTTGLQRVLAGGLSQTGKQVDTKPTGEKVYQDTPFYEAAKRDAMNLGEGLLGLASAAIGFNQDELEKAQAEMQKEGRPTEGFMAGVERGGRAGLKKGEEFAGGIPTTGIFLGKSAADLFTGEAGKKFYREAPITTMISALPILKSLGRGVAAGTLSTAQKARVAQLLAKTTNPATGKAFATLGELTDAIETIERKARVGEELTPSEAGVAGYKGIPTEALASAVSEQAGKVLPRVAKVAAKGAERLPYVAAAYSLGGAPAALGAGLLAYGGPLLDAFKGTSALGKAQQAVARKGAKVKRQLVERRTYEEPMAEQVGEEALTAAGEARAVEAKVGDLPERFANTQRTFINVPEIVSAEQLRMPTEFEKLNTTRNELANKLVQARELVKLFPEETTYQDALSQIENAITQNEQKATALTGTPEQAAALADAKAQTEAKIIEAQTKKAFPLPTRLNTEEGGSLVIGDESSFKVNENLLQEKPRVVAINTQAPENATLFEGLKRSLQGTELSPYDEATGAETPSKLYEAQRLFTTLAASRQMPTLTLLDPEVRTKTIELIEKQTGKTLTNEAKVSLDQKLVEIGNEGFEDKGKVKGATPQLTIKNYQIRTPIGPEGTTTPIDTFNLNNVVSTAVEQLGKSPERVVFRNFLNRYSERLRTTGGTSAPTGGLIGKAGGFTSEFDKAVAGGDRTLLGNLFQQFGEKASDDLISVSNKAKTLELLNAELTEPRIAGEQYKNFIRNLRDKVDRFTPNKEGIATFESVANLPFDRDFVVNSDKPEVASKIVGLWKRFATTYNPAVLFGNFVGNAVVESQATGTPTPVVLVEQTARAINFARRVAEAKKAQNLNITDEIALRALPQDAVGIVENFNNFAVEEKFPITKAFQVAYEWGDRLPKTAEAVKQSETLVNRLQRAPSGKTFLLQTGPNLDVYLVKNGSDNYSVINPRSGKLVASGTLDSAQVKRVLGASVRSALETKFPDVRNLPQWYERVSRAKGGITGAASVAVVFQPFLSYVLKAADSPYRTGIMGNLMTMNDNPILAEFGGTGKKQSVGTLFENIVNDTRTTRNYLLSRGMINGFMSRYNSLNQDERQQLREYFAFYPTEPKSLVLGELMQLVRGDKVRKTNEPSYGNAWQMTDTYVRSIPAIVNTLQRITGLGREEIAKELGSENPSADLVIDRYAMGTIPDERDVLKAVAMNGGQAKDLFYKLTDPNLGAKPITLKDYGSIFGVAGKILKGLSPSGVSEGEIDIKGEKSFLQNTVPQFIVDNLVGGSILDPKMTDLKINKLIKGSYDECWNNLIQPLLTDAEKERKKGNDDRAEELEEIASNLNDKIQERITANVEARVETLAKIGIDTNLKSGDYKKVFRDIQGREEIMVRPEEQPEEPTSPAVFERTQPYNYPETPAGKYKMEE